MGSYQYEYGLLMSEQDCFIFKLVLGHTELGAECLKGNHAVLKIDSGDSIMQKAYSSLLSHLHS